MAHLLDDLRNWKPPTERTHLAKDVEEINLLVDWGGQTKQLGRITLRSDASLYVWVYGKIGRYYYGLEEFPPDKQSHTFDFSKNCTMTAPHLSVHVSGQTHIRDHTVKKGYLAGPVQLPQLSTFRGEHVASIVADDLQALPDFREALVFDDKRRDLLIGKDGDIRSARLIIFANAVAPQFKCEKTPYLTINNRRLGKGRHTGPPMFYGIVALAQEPLSQEGPGTGVLMMSGWSPMEPDRLLYVRAQ